MSRFTKHQIISIIKVADAGLKVPDISCQHGISQDTFINGNPNLGVWRELAFKFNPRAKF